MSEPTPIDRHIEKVRQGDLDAYGEVVRATQDRLRAYILWLCPERDAVDDLAQEVYLYAYRNLDTYELGTNLLAWLKKIAHYRAINRARASAAQARREKRYFDECILAAAAHLEVPAPQDDRLTVLRDCLRHLPEESLALIQQRYERNLDANRLAVLLNKSATAIRVSLWRIREQLRRCVASKRSPAGVPP